MPLPNDTQRVRSLIGDMNKAATLEDVARGDGNTTDYQLDMVPVRTGTLTVYSNAAAISASANFPLGVFQITNSAPAAGNTILATYQYNALSDDEIDSIVSSVSGTIGDKLLLAASIGCRAIAANYARFFAYTQGQKSVDKNQQAKKLTDLAESYQSAYEFSIKNGAAGMRVASFDDSGTVFDSYDTASSVITQDTFDYRIP